MRPKTPSTESDSPFAAASFTLRISECHEQFKEKVIDPMYAMTRCVTDRDPVSHRALRRLQFTAHQCVEATPL
jgi:hypothetical protein